MCVYVYTGNIDNVRDENIIRMYPVPQHDEIMLMTIVHNAIIWCHFEKIDIPLRNGLKIIFGTVRLYQIIVKFWCGVYHWCDTETEYYYSSCVTDNIIYSMMTWRTAYNCCWYGCIL